MIFFFYGILIHLISVNYIPFHINGFLYPFVLLLMVSSKAKEAFALVSNCLMMDKDSYSILLGKQMVKTFQKPYMAW